MYRFLTSIGMTVFCSAQPPQLEAAQVVKIAKRIIEARSPFKDHFDLDHPKYSEKDHLWHFDCRDCGFVEAPQYFFEIRDSDQYFRVWVLDASTLRTQRALDLAKTFRASPR